MSGGRLLRLMEENRPGSCSSGQGKAESNSSGQAKGEGKSSGSATSLRHVLRTAPCLGHRVELSASRRPSAIMSVLCFVSTQPCSETTSYVAWPYE